MIFLFFIYPSMKDHHSKHSESRAFDESKSAISRASDDQFSMDKGLPATFTPTCHTHQIANLT